MTNRLANRLAAGSRAAYVAGTSTLLPTNQRVSFEWTYEIGSASSGGIGDSRALLVGVDPSLASSFGPNAQSVYLVGHDFGQGWRVARRNAGAFDGTTYAPFVTTVLGTDASAASLSAGVYNLAFTLDAALGFYELKVNGTVVLTGVDPAPLAVGGKRFGFYLNNTAVAAGMSAFNYGLEPPIRYTTYVLVPDNPLTIASDPLDGVTVAVDGDDVATPVTLDDAIYPTAGETVTVVAPAAISGYRFRRWEMNGTEVATSPAYAFVASAGPMALKAVYRPLGYGYGSVVG